MKKRLSILSIFLLSFGILSSAHALTFTLIDYNINLLTQDPGLVLDYQKLLPDNSGFNLGVGGSSSTVGLFDIWTVESSVNAEDDLSHSPISVGLNFTASVYNFGGTITGETYGIRGGFLGSYQAGRVVWNGPAFLNFGPDNSGLLIGSLSNRTFNQGYFWGTGSDSATVDLTLSYRNEVSDAAAPVPEPTTVLLLGSGLLSFVWISRKKLKK